MTSNVAERRSVRPARGGREPRPRAARPRAGARRSRRPAPDRPPAIGVARLVRARHGASRTSDRAVGVDRRACGPDLADHPLPPDGRRGEAAADHRRHAGEHGQDHADDRDEQRDPRERQPVVEERPSRAGTTTEAMPVHTRGTPGLDVDAEAEHGEDQQADAARGWWAARRGRSRRARKNAAPDEPGDADAGGEELEEQQRHPDGEQQVGHRRAGHGVGELVDEGQGTRTGCGSPAPGGDRAPSVPSTTSHLDRDAVVGEADDEVAQGGRLPAPEVGEALLDRLLGADGRAARRLEAALGGRGRRRRPPRPGAKASSRAAAPDGPTHTVTGTSASSMAASSWSNRSSSTTAPGLSSWSTTATAPQSSASATRLARRSRRARGRAGRRPRPPGPRRTGSGAVARPRPGPGRRPSRRRRDAATRTTRPRCAVARVRNDLTSTSSIGLSQPWIQRGSSLHPGSSSWPGRAASAKPPSAPPRPSPPPGQGCRCCLVEIEGKSGLAGLFGREPLGYDEVELADGRPGPDHHPRRGAARVPARPRPEPDLEAAGVARAPSSSWPPPSPGIRDILVLGQGEGARASAAPPTWSCSTPRPPATPSPSCCRPGASSTR